MSANPASLEKTCLAGFLGAYGSPPLWAASAPGRVNVIGEHLDYNDGFVLPAAIDRRVLMMARPVDEPRITLGSAAYPGQPVILPLGEPLHPSKPVWANYLRGVLASFSNNQASALSQGLEVWIESDIPLGGGLSSSAALSVAFATLLNQITGAALTPVALAKRCQAAEHDFAGVPCGIMDQFASTLSRQGQLLLIDCRSEATEWIPFSAPDLVLLVADTRVKHALGSGEYARRRQDCDEALRLLDAASWRDVTLAQLQAGEPALGPVRFRRARHVVTETDRTLQAVACLRKGDWRSLGSLLFASHASLRDDYEVSCEELDAVVTIAGELADRGVLGARMTGAGFGGCTLSLVEAVQLDAVGKIYRDRYRALTGKDLSVFVTTPSAGAAPIDLPIDSTDRP